MSSRQITSLLWDLLGRVRRGRLALLATVVAAVVAGLANSMLLVFANEALNSLDEPAWTLIVGFGSLCVLLPASRFVSQYLQAWLSTELTFAVRMNLSSELLRMPLRHLETCGGPRIYGALTHDVPAVMGLLVTFPTVIMHSTLLIGCLGYLGWLAPPVLGSILLVIAIGVVSYQFPIRHARKHMTITRERLDRVLEHFRAIAYGAKELKQHAGRRRAFWLEDLRPDADDMRRSSLRGRTIYAAAQSWSQAFFFIVVGLLIFLLPAVVDVDRKVVTGYVLTILFMVGSIEALLNLLPGWTRTEIAMEKLETLGVSLADSDPPFPAEPTVPGSVRRLDLQGVTFSYGDGDGSERDDFRVGPIDLTLQAGEVVFLTGGNGSGKTTLGKLVVGLYEPDAGRILIDGREVRPETLEAYRQSFTSVFAELYLFQRLLGLRSADLDLRARRYLEELELAHKVEIEDGVLSTTDLSSGQRKRLALLTAYLEDRPVYLFDEWAAAQDPIFRKIFYERILADLKKRGKLVLVISHDDRYFGLADRVVAMEFGQIKTEEVQSGPGEEVEVSA